MDQTPNLGLPYIMAAQAQKHVTHNEAIRALDAILQLAVLDRDLAVPPSAPGDGDRYIVAASPTGAWTGRADEIAAYQDNAWMFYEPIEGWIAWVADEDAALVWDGSAWIAFSSGGGGGGGGAGSFTTLGVNATADTTNRLSLASAASLFNHAGAGHQMKINKAAAADTASLLFQRSFSGRAEMGLAGDDDFRFKVSGDGSSWHDAIQVDRNSGLVSLPNTPAGAAANANVLLNGDFQINQREFAGGALGAGTYGHDRWKADTGGASYSVSGYVVTLTSGAIQQHVEPAMWGYAILASTAVTISVDSPSADLTVTAGTVSGAITAGSGRRSVTITTASGDTGTIPVKIAKSTGGTVTFGRVKAEIGAAMTPWSKRFAPSEMQLCQYYFRRLKPGVVTSPIGPVANASSSTVVDQYLALAPDMRSAPAMTFSALADFAVLGPTGTALTPTACSLPTSSAIAVLLRWTVASGLNQGDSVRVRTAASGGWVAFDAEI